MFEIFFFFWEILKIVGILIIFIFGKKKKFRICVCNKKNLFLLIFF